MKWGGLDKTATAGRCYKSDLLPRNLCVSNLMGFDSLWF